MSPVRSDFWFWWIVGLFLCQIFAATVAGLVIVARSPKSLEIAAIAYWILIGLVQWRLLKPYVTWAYQWGLVTTIGGILGSWLILTLFSRFFPGEEHLGKLEQILLSCSILFTGRTPLNFGSSPLPNALIVAGCFGILAGILCTLGVLTGFIQWLLLKWHAPNDDAVWIALGNLAWIVVIVPAVLKSDRSIWVWAVPGTCSY